MPVGTHYIMHYIYTLCIHYICTIRRRYAKRLNDVQTRRGVLIGSAVVTGAPHAHFPPSPLIFSYKPEKCLLEQASRSFSPASSKGRRPCPTCSRRTQTPSGTKPRSTSSSASRSTRCRRISSGGSSRQKRPRQGSGDSVPALCNRYGAFVSSVCM